MIPIATAINGAGARGANRSNPSNNAIMTIPNNKVVGEVLGTPWKSESRLSMNVPRAK